MIALAAMSLNRVIGKDGKLPWPSIKEDFAFFRKMTMGQHILVGHTTFKLLPPLKGRTVWVLTRNQGPISIPHRVADKGGVAVTDVKDIPTDAVICGGAQIYSLLLPSCDKLFLTTVKNSYEGDTYMPPFEHLFQPPTIIENGETYSISEFLRRT